MTWASPPKLVLLAADDLGRNPYAAAHWGALNRSMLLPLARIEVATGFALRQPFRFGRDGVISAMVAGSVLRREHRPGNPHRTAQMQLFVEHWLRPVDFWHDDVLDKTMLSRA
jgi:hypothetical protein